MLETTPWGPVDDDFCIFKNDEMHLGALQNCEKAGSHFGVNRPGLGDNLPLNLFGAPISHEFTVAANPDRTDCLDRVRVATGRA